jgi:hypothetical protein
MHNDVSVLSRSLKLSTHHHRASRVLRELQALQASTSPRETRVCTALPDITLPVLSRTGVGDTGRTGEVGLPGVNGAVGAQGAQGAAGPKGFKGRVGVDGVAGTVRTILTAFAFPQLILACCLRRTVHPEPTATRVTRESQAHQAPTEPQAPTAATAKLVSQELMAALYVVHLL